MFGIINAQGCTWFILHQQVCEDAQFGLGDLRKKKTKCSSYLVYCLAVILMFILSYTL